MYIYIKLEHFEFMRFRYGIPSTNHFFRDDLPLVKSMWIPPEVKTELDHTVLAAMEAGHGDGLEAGCGRMCIIKKT
jgi:hypothetical protein